MDFTHLATIAGWLSHARDLVGRIFAVLIPRIPSSRLTHVRLSVGHGWLVWERASVTRVQKRGSTKDSSPLRSDAGF